jgi:hypothetical protein
LAKKESEDSTAANGGEVGWLTQAQLPSPLDKAVFNLAKGEISNVIESPTGFHIVKVEDIRDEKTQSLKDATAEITRALKAEKGKREAAKLADRDREKALSGNDFAKLGQESGVAVNVTRPFTNGEVRRKSGNRRNSIRPPFHGSRHSPVIEGTNAYYVLAQTANEPRFHPSMRHGQH